MLVRVVSAVGLSLLAAFASSANATDLTSGQSVAGSISANGEVDTFTFNAQAGDTYWVLMAAENLPTNPRGRITPELTIISPSGTRAGDDDAAATVTRTVSESGVYTVLAQDWDANGEDRRGDYRIDFLLIPGAVENSALVSGTTIDGTLASGGDIDSYTFSAGVGTSVWLSAAPRYSDVDASLFVYKPDGSLVVDLLRTPSNSITYGRGLAVGFTN